MQEQLVRWNRRELLKNSLGITLGVSFGFSISWDPVAEGRDSGLILQTFVRLFPDNSLEIVVAKAEMGQGVASSMALLIADEMDADWNLVQVRTEGERKPYTDPNGWSGTAGSTSVRFQFQRLRKVGAEIRALVLEAAAKKWQVPVAQLKTQGSEVWTQDGRRLGTYGELLELLPQIPLPTRVALKKPSEWTLIGQNTPSKQARLKAEGKLPYSIDLKLPGMLYAAVRQPKIFGARVSNSAELPSLVAAPYRLLQDGQNVFVVGPSYWKAQKILDKLPIRYDSSYQLSQAGLEQKLFAAVQTKAGFEAAKKGDGAGALQLCEAVIEAEYFGPLLAHHTMEPLNATGWVTGDRCEFWIPTQTAEGAAAAIAAKIGRSKEQVLVHATPMGGGFGRKMEQDFVEQVAYLAKTLVEPVQLIWSRTEDTQHDFYRPAFAAKLSAGLSNGQLRVWSGKNAGPSLQRKRDPANPKLDPSAVDGFAEVPYDIENFEAWSEDVDLGVPVGFWRSVGLSQNAFFTECFLDEVAHSLNQDPLAFRRSLLTREPRLQRILDRLASLSQWYDSPNRQRMGVALLEGFGSMAGMVAQVVLEKKKVKVERLWIVVDCGQVVHRSGAEAQVQGGALFGLAAALNGKITVKDGQVEQNFFGDLPFLKLGDSPQIAVEFIEADSPLGGLGEVATPLAAPAVCNALFAATGQRIRRLPIKDFVWVDSL